MTSEERQGLVNKLIVMKVMSDYCADTYKAMLGEYGQVAFETAKMPKGDTSEIGDVTVVYNKATEDEVEQVFTVNDMGALIADTSEDFAEYLMKTWIPQHMPEAAEAYFNEVGELLDGCEVVQQVIPGKPKSVKYFKAVPDKGFKKKFTEYLSEQTLLMLNGVRGQIEE